MVNVVLHPATGYSTAMFRLIEWLFEWVLGAVMGPLMKKARDYGGKLGRAGALSIPEIILNLFRVGDYQNTLAMCNLGRSVGQDLDVLRAHVLMQLGDLRSSRRHPYPSRGSGEKSPTGRPGHLHIGRSLPLPT